MKAIDEMRIAYTKMGYNKYTMKKEFEKEVVSSEEGKVLNEFLEAKREELDETLMVYYRGIIKRIGKKTYN